MCGVRAIGDAGAHRERARRSSKMPKSRALTLKLWGWGEGQGRVRDRIGPRKTSLSAEQATQRRTLRLVRVRVRG